ncbi:MAG: protein kinase [Planctomycetes bacterium]|nr:protein kinase [Planctomycetota bacterium]
MDGNEPTQQLQGIDDDAAFEASLLTDSMPLDAAALTSPLPVTAPHPAPPPEQPSWVGKRLGRFKLLRLLGEGSMGRVIEAMDVNLRRIVALKVLRKRVVGVDQQAAVEQFLREARAAAIIEHPNIVRIFEINEEQGWWYIAMEMVEGGTLRDLVKASEEMSTVMACTLIGDAATALAVAHKRGIIHRDIKPNNLLVSRDGRCKVSDFGLVRVDDPNDPFDFTDMSVGTPKYMAPEVIRRQAQTPAIDIYSLGATLYFALTGEAPYTGKTMKEIIEQHLHAPPPDVRRTRPDIPEPLSRLVRHMMAKNPQDRPTAREVASILCAEQVELRPDASSGSTLLRRELGMDDSVVTRVFHHVERRPGAWLGAAAGVVTAIVLMVYLLTRPAHEGPNFPIAFTDAPASYGPRVAAEAPPTASSPVKAPPFSWVGKVDPKGAPFVSSISAIHYWPIDDPAARLIRADQVVFYATASAAEFAGKHAAP